MQQHSHPQNGNIAVGLISDKEWSLFAPKLMQSKILRCIHVDTSYNLCTRKLGIEFEKYD